MVRIGKRDGEKRFSFVDEFRSVQFFLLLLWVILYSIHSYTLINSKHFDGSSVLFLLKCIRQEIKNFFDIDDTFFWSK